MKSKEELAYNTISTKLAQLLPSSKPQQKVVKPKDLSFLNKLSGFPKQDVKNITYITKVEKEPVFESPETLAAKLNSLPGGLGAHVIKDLFTIDDVISAIKNLKGNDRLDVSHLRNGEQLSRIAQRQDVNMNDMRWHGSGGTNGTALNGFIQVDVFNSTNGQTIFTASKTVVATLLFTISGANQTPTTDYTTTSTNATLTVGTWPSGVPVDQPVVWVYLNS